jgi:hypothetical protein
VCRLNNKYTVNICLGLPADKDRIKLCATWIDVEINLTLVSHWFYFSVSLYLSRKDEENVAFLSLIFLINYDISLALKSEYLKPHISIKRFRDEVIFLRICLKHYPWPELSELLHFFPYAHSNYRNMCCNLIIIHLFAKPIPKYLLPTQLTVY